MAARKPCQQRYSLAGSTRRERRKMLRAPAPPGESLRLVAGNGIEPLSRAYEARVLPLHHPAVSLLRCLPAPYLEHQHAVFRPPYLCRVPPAQNLPNRL